MFDMSILKRESREHLTYANQAYPFYLFIYFSSLELKLCLPVSGEFGVFVR